MYITCEDVTSKDSLLISGLILQDPLKWPESINVKQHSIFAPRLRCCYWILDSSFLDAEETQIFVLIFTARSYWLSL